jgi:hypothetical protein
MSLVAPITLKPLLGISGSDFYDDDRLQTACDAATQMISAVCDRQFEADTVASSRVFVALTPHLCEIDDIASTAGLVVQTDNDANGTFDQTWSAGDYQLEPLNARLAGQPWPYTQVRAVNARTFPFDGRQALVRITAVWGWPSVPAAIIQAAEIQAVSLFKSADAPLGVAGFGDIGIMRLRQAMHPVAAALVAPYRRDPVLVA